MVPFCFRLLSSLHRQLYLIPFSYVASSTEVDLFIICKSLFSFTLSFFPVQVSLFLCLLKAILRFVEQRESLVGLTSTSGKGDKGEVKREEKPVQQLGSDKGDDFGAKRGNTEVQEALKRSKRFLFPSLLGPGPLSLASYFSSSLLHAFSSFFLHLS